MTVVARGIDEKINAVQLNGFLVKKKIIFIIYFLKVQLYLCIYLFLYLSIYIFLSYNFSALKIFSSRF